MADTIIDGTGEELPGRRILSGTDLEIAYSLLGDDLVLRVNKAGVQVFGVVLQSAAKAMTAAQLLELKTEQLRPRGQGWDARRGGRQRGLCAWTGGWQVGQDGARENEQDLAARGRGREARDYIKARAFVLLCVRRAAFFSRRRAARARCCRAWIFLRRESVILGMGVYHCS